MNKLSKIRALLFDLDGTLADTHGLILQCFDHAMRTHLGKAGPREVWETRIGLPLEDIFRATFAHYGEEEPQTEQMETMKQTYRAHMRDNDSALKPFPGIREVLAALQLNGVRMGIVTTKHQKMAIRHLEQVGLSSFFEPNAVICGDMCARYKPAPEPFLRGLHELDARPEQTAMVGDSQFDISGARCAGIFAVAACWGTDNRADLLAARPDYTAEIPADLLTLLQL